MTCQRARGGLVSKKIDPEDQPWVGKNTMPGFTITCDRCGSTEVYLENTMGHSAESGGWGELTLICNACNHRADIYENF